MACNILETVVGSLLLLLNQKTNNLLILINFGSIIKSKLLFLNCVVISDLHLFQESIPLNH